MIAVLDEELPRFIENPLTAQLLCNRFSRQFPALPFALVRFLYIQGRRLPCSGQLGMLYISLFTWNNHALTMG